MEQGKCITGTQQLFAGSFCSKEKILPRNFCNTGKAKNFWITILFIQDMI